MYGVLLQDWTTVRLTGATNTVVQSEELWLDVDDYRDVIFWLEVKHYTTGGAGAVLGSYETAPTKDEALFRSMSSFPLGVGSVPYITKVLAEQNPSFPLSTWLRWRLSIVGTPTTEWGASFRIFCSLNRARVP